MSLKPKRPQEAPTKAEASKRTGRRGTKRSRDGCLTCKLRRVKCDESKPECKRCLNSQYKCDGYATDAKEKTKQLGSGPKLLPAPPTGLNFQNDVEHGHFDDFRRNIIDEVTGSFDPIFWDRVVLQACHEEPFVLKMVLAMSAMRRSRILEHEAGRHQSGYSIAKQNSHFALAQYQEALKGMRNKLAQEKSPRKALIACLLVCCFEGLAGNDTVALAHAASGQKLLEEFMAKHPYKQSHQAGLLSPAPDIIEDDLIHAARFFDLELVTCFDKRPQTIHKVMQHEGDAAVLRMPNTFDTVEDARMYALLLGRRLLHFMRGTMDTNSTTHIVTIRPGKILSSPQSPIPKSVGNSPFPRDSIPEDELDRIEAGQNRHVKELHRWLSAFEVFYRRAESSRNSRTCRATHILYVFVKSMEIYSLSNLQSRKPYLYDNYLPVFQDILSTAKKIVAVEENTGFVKFNFGVSILPALHMTARCCRDRVLRKEAISLMSRYSTREGSWNSRFTLALDTLLVSLEEEGVESEDIPESSRVGIWEVIFAEEKKYVKLRYYREGKGPIEISEAISRW